MICSSCRRTFISRLPSRTRSNGSQKRRTTSSPSTSPLPRQPSSDISMLVSKTSPSAISSDTPGISQPLSTPMLPSTSSASRPTKSATLSRSPKLPGSIPGGTLLRGLGYLKATPAVYAKEDDEYPAWLWTLLDSTPDAASHDGKSIADVSALPKLAREKYQRKQEKFLKQLPKRVPLHEQSTDLTQPGDSADISQQRRHEVVRSSRAARRKGIKEENFLRGL